MFTPFHLFIGQRYSRIKGKNHFISFISLTSMLGIALGVMVLITVMSVMNGFSKEIRSQMLKGVPHITLQSGGELMKDWQAIDTTLQRQYPEIAGASPYIMGQGILSGPSQVQGILINGIDANKINEVIPLKTHLIAGELANLKAEEFGIILGRELAYNLGLHINDKVSVIVPEISTTLAGITPRIKRFTLIGIFEINYFYDNSQAFIHIADAAKLFRMQNGVTGLQIKLHDELQAPQLAQALGHTFRGKYAVHDWSHENASFFQAIKIQKTVMLFILLLIIAVAAFNLVSSLVMMVTDKRGDIAILRTLGATPVQIMAIFMIQGSIIGCIGTLLGLCSGLLLAYNITDLYNYLEKTLQLNLIPLDVYLINFLPSEIHAIDVMQICGLTLALSFLATLYPAWTASRIHPAEALRYE